MIIINKHYPKRNQHYFIHLSLDDPSEAQKEEFTFEIEQMKQLGSHKNVVSMVGCCTLEDKSFLVIGLQGLNKFVVLCLKRGM